jgi:hypothetical protein
MLCRLLRGSVLCRLYRLGQWIGYNWIDTIKTASRYYLLRFFLDRGSSIENLDGNGG